MKPKEAYKWTHPMSFAGTYPNSWAGYIYLQWSDLSKNWHEGVDYNGPGGCDADKGMALFACANGVLEWWGYHNGWGYHFYIRHEDPVLGTTYSHYAHCLKDSLKVKVGDEVKVGQVVAQVGDSGWNDMCAHVHFEIRKPIGQGYDFWANPANGWDKKKVSENYYDPFLFIEERKNREEPVDDCEKKLNSMTDERNKALQDKARAESDLRSERESRAKEKGEQQLHIEQLQGSLSLANESAAKDKLELDSLREERDDLKTVEKESNELIKSLTDENTALGSNLQKSLTDKIKLEQSLVEEKKKKKLKDFTKWELFLGIFGR